MKVTFKFDDRDAVDLDVETLPRQHDTIRFAGDEHDYTVVELIIIPGNYNGISNQATLRIEKW